MKAKKSKPQDSVAMGKMSLVARLEMAPMELSLWEELASRLKEQNDSLSIKSVEVITYGLRSLEAAFKKTMSIQAPLPKLTTLSASQFTRLTKSYNNPRLLKDVGTIYLNEFRLPDVALKHFERSRELGYTDRDLTQLTETASLLTQKQTALENGNIPLNAGVNQAKNARPVVADVIRKTDRLIMPSSLRPPTTSKQTSKFEPSEQLGKAELPESTEACLIAARHAMGESRLNHAYAYLMEANKKPESDYEMWNAWAELGMAYYESNIYDGMEAAYEKALKYAPDEVASHFNLALARHLNEKFEEAQTLYHTALQIDPQHPKVYCNLGVLYFQKEQYKHAEDALRQAIEVRPDYPRAWDNLGSALGAQDKLEEALQACRKAIEYNPAYPEAHFKMGIIHFSTGREKEAAKSFREAFHLPILKPIIYSFMAIIHARADQRHQAESCIRMTIATNHKCDFLWTAWTELAISHYRAKEYDKAIAACENAIRCKTDESEIWFNLGSICHAAGDHRRSQHCYQQAVELKPNHDKAWHYLGILLASQGFHSEAIKAFETALTINPTSQRVWYHYGECLLLDGKKEEATIAFAEMEELTRESASSSVASSQR